MYKKEKEQMAKKFFADICSKKASRKDMNEILQIVNEIANLGILDQENIHFFEVENASIDIK